MANAEALGWGQALQAKEEKGQYGRGKEAQEGSAGCPPSSVHPECQADTTGDFGQGWGRLCVFLEMGR